uniref:(northern house mosquito) hypothetical protein n=1 Tax=Culex pipiens TaxID=7175 RepID=A0A8D8N932_CULPI
MDTRRGSTILVGSRNQRVYDLEPSKIVPERANMRAKSGESERSSNDLDHLFVCNIFRARGGSGFAPWKASCDKPSRLLLLLAAAHINLADVLWVSLFAPMHLRNSGRCPAYEGDHVAQL